jgi:formiminotetrahydrofolate cyclodeaminase
MSFACTEKNQRALKKAADPPLCTAVTSPKVLKLCQEVLDNGNPSAMSDATAGILLGHAALLAGTLNLRVNLDALDDHPYIEGLNARRASDLEEESNRMKEEIMARVRE